MLVGKPLLELSLMLIFSKKVLPCHHPLFSTQFLIHYNFNAYFLSLDGLDDKEEHLEIDDSSVVQFRDKAIADLAAQLRDANVLLFFPLCPKCLELHSL